LCMILKGERGPKFLAGKGRVNESEGRRKTTTSWAELKARTFCVRRGAQSALGVLKRWGGTAGGRVGNVVKGLADALSKL